MPRHTSADCIQVVATKLAGTPRQRRRAVRRSTRSTSRAASSAATASSRARSTRSRSRPSSSSRNTPATTSSTRVLLVRETDAGRRSRALRHSDPGLEVRVLMDLVLAASAANVLVWIVWIVAALALLASGIAVVLFARLVRQHARTDQQPRIAGGALPAPGERVRRRRPGDRLRRGDRDHVRLRPGIPRRAGGRALGQRAEPQNMAAVVAAAAIALQVIIVIALKAGNRRATRPRSPGRSGRPRKSGSSSSPTTSSPSK